MVATTRQLPSCTPGELACIAWALAKLWPERLHHTHPGEGTALRSPTERRRSLARALRYRASVNAQRGTTGSRTWGLSRGSITGSMISLSSFDAAELYGDGMASASAGLVNGVGSLGGEAAYNTAGIQLVFLEAFLGASQPLLADCSAAQLSQVLWGLASLGARASLGWRGAALEAVQRTIRRKATPPNAVATLLRAVAMLELAPSQAWVYQVVQVGVQCTERQEGLQKVERLYVVPSVVVANGVTVPCHTLLYLTTSTHTQ